MPATAVAAQPRALEIAQTRVAIPAFHALGHGVEELPTVARLDTLQHTLPFDVRDYPDVCAAVTTTPEGRRTSEGIWTTDHIAYACDDMAGLLGWLWHKAADWNEAARRALFWREARPLGILERLIAANVVTDNGALTQLKVIGNAAPATFYNHLQMATGALTAQLSGAMGATGATAIPVISGGASFTNGMLITLGYGTANTEVVTVGAGSTATSIVCSATTKTHAANDWVVQNPTTSDNPSSVSNGYDSGALAAGAFTYSGTGQGNRQVQVVYNFPSNSGAPGSGYTDLWTTSAATIAAGTTGSHLTRSPLLVNGSTGANVTYTDNQ